MVRTSGSVGNPHGKSLSRAEIKAFQKTVYTAAAAQYRDFPWRHTRSPYRILVSEFMLQQTQATRVEEPYRTFLQAFPSLKQLAAAPLAAVLERWQGLGYNRRARALHELAKTVVSERAGRIPRVDDELQSLPGVGPYTAAAVRAFAFNEPVVMVETNIREVFLRHFFLDAESVTDAQLEPYVEATLDTAAPYQWYTVLMDYGAYLKRTGHRAARRSRTYKKQSPFQGSGRQVRGAIIRALVAGPSSPARLARACDCSLDVLSGKLDELVAEGLVERRGKRVVLAR